MIATLRALLHCTYATENLVAWLSGEQRLSAYLLIVTKAGGW